ncbi:pre-mRNA-splicing factor CWC22 [Salvia divinorum]|uniref:Pre-mRNA-splicing factor CWC22 n=1 Tax=Salvia divinorum TaxID=28513 RepID=A0ABD1HMR5_SALDI
MGQLLTLLLEKPTNDSVEVAVGFVAECGSLLQDLCPKGMNGVLERLRGILHEGDVGKRVQFLIEGLFALRKAAKFQIVRPELDLVEEDDQFTHQVSLLDEIDGDSALDVFRPDPQFVENEKMYEDLKKQILPEDEGDEDEGANSEDGDEEEDGEQIKDETGTDLVNLREPSI